MLAHMAPALAVHAPLVHENAAVPVVGETVSITVNTPPDSVGLAVALHALAPTFQLSAVATQLTGLLATSAAQEAEAGALHTPLLQTKFAAPVVPVMSCSRILDPDAAGAAVALQVLPPTVHDSADVVQSTAAAAQLAFCAAPQTPLLQLKFAEPVVPNVSCNTVAAPELAAGACALQVLAPTVHDSALALQLLGCWTHDAPVGTPQAPLLHASVATPVVGPTMSYSTKLEPDVVLAAYALQLVPFAVHVCVPAAQLAGGAVQLDEVGPLHAPLVHEYPAVPVLGVVMFCKIKLEPDVLAAAVALHVLPPTVQLNGVATQGAAVATVVVPQLSVLGAPQTPLLHEYTAAPVTGATVSCNPMLEPDVVIGAAALQLFTPTVHVCVRAAQSAGGTMQLDALGVLAHRPLLHANVAVPIEGAVRSDSTLLEPDGVTAVTALEALPFTTQFKAAPAAQSAGGNTQVAAVGALAQAPLVQANVAVPVDGAVMSDSTLLEPDGVPNVVALQTLPLTVQLNALPAAQSAGGVTQVAVVGAVAQTPVPKQA